jgi:excisionase family DNA binding protein
VTTKNEGKAERATRGLLNVEQYAEAIGQKPSTVRRKVLNRAIEFVRIGRSIRFRPESVDELIAAGTVPARED